MRYAWARDEWRRLDAEQSEWRSQLTFTVRFRHILDPEAIEEIHARIIKEARFVRHMSQILARAAMSERVVVSVDPKGLSSTDPLQLHEWLTSSGMTIVSAGYGRQVVEWIEVLNPDHRRETRVQLIAAYAQVSLGRNQEALGHLSVAFLGIDQLPGPDQQFMEYLRDVCEYQTGGIDLAEYLKREQEWAQRLTGVAAAEHRLEFLRQERLTVRDSRRRKEMLEEMRAKCEQIQSVANAKTPYRIQARIILLGAEGDDLTGKFMEDVSLVQARRKMGFPVEDLAQQSAAAIVDRLWEWEKSACKLIEEAVAEGHPLLIANALTARVTIYDGLLICQRMEAEANGRHWEAPPELISVLMRNAEQAMEIYRRAGNLEGETRAKLLLADLFETAAQEQAAIKLAEGAITVARALSYPKLEAHANEHIEGRTVFKQFQACIGETENRRRGCPYC